MLTQPLKRVLCCELRCSHETLGALSRVKGLMGSYCDEQLAAEAAALSTAGGASSASQRAERASAGTATSHPDLLPAGATASASSSDELPEPASAATESTKDQPTAAAVDGAAGRGGTGAHALCRSASQDDARNGGARSPSATGADAADQRGQHRFSSQDAQQVQQDAMAELSPCVPARSVFRPNSAGSAPPPVCGECSSAAGDHRHASERTESGHRPATSRPGLLQAIGPCWIDQDAQVAEHIDTATLVPLQRVDVPIPTAQGSERLSSAADSLPAGSNEVSTTSSGSAKCSPELAQSLTQRLQELEARSHACQTGRAAAHCLDVVQSADRGCAACVQGTLAASSGDYDMREVMLLEESLAVEAALRGPANCLPRAQRLCRAYNGVATRWLNAGASDATACVVSLPSS